MHDAIPQHDGSAADAASDGLVPPDSKIGEVRSAESTHTGSGPRAASTRERQQGWIDVLGWGLGIGFIVGAAARAAGDFHLLEVSTPIATAAGIGAGCAAMVAAMIARALPRGFSSYVGTRGCQWCRTGPSGTAVEVLAFDECEGVTSSVVDELENHAYRRTSYRYAFHRRGRKPGVLAGSYHRDDEGPGAPSRFARAAAAAWAEHRWPFLDAELRAGRGVSFEAGPFRIEVRRDAVHVHHGDRTERLGRQELGAVCSAQGWLVLKKRGAEGYSPSLFFTRQRGWVERRSVLQLPEAEIRDLPLLRRALAEHLGLA